MTPKDILRHLVDADFGMIQAYLSDFSDADLLVRPVPEANHTAWQLGHLIVGSRKMLSELGRTPPPLPAGFDTAYTKETTALNDPAKFHKKAEYLALADKMKAASLAAIDATPDIALDSPGPEFMRQFAPTVADVLAILGQHWLMHAGQIVVLRRKLGKPILF